MGTLDGDLQSQIRAQTGTAGQWIEDWNALFDKANVPAGQWGERLMSYYTRYTAGPNTVSTALNYFLQNPSHVGDHILG